jgi:hypothetical protein
MAERQLTDYPHVDLSPAARRHGTQATRGLQDVPHSSLSTPVASAGCFVACRRLRPQIRTWNS